MKSDKIGYECDSNGNQHRVRITMINYNKAEIYFGDVPINPSFFIGKSDIIDSKYKSYQLSIYSRKCIVCKPSELYEPHADFKSFYENYNKKISQIYNELTELLSKEKHDIKTHDILEQVPLRYYNDEKKINSLIESPVGEFKTTGIINQAIEAEQKLELERDKYAKYQENYELIINEINKIK